MIDLRSDTVTKPSAGMLQAMMAADVGDDVFSEDSTVNRLESRLAEMFGLEAGLFCPSGTMTNQIAVNVHTRSGDEVICDRLSHVYHYEGGGIARNSGASVRLLAGDRGRFSAADVAQNINPDDFHFPVTRLVVAENTCNKGGGSCWDYSMLAEISQLCGNNDLKFHLDGARIFNALIATGQQAAEYGKIFDSISICFSKGLGAPVGSVLLGNREFINSARRVRKVFGGGMRQAGYLAAAGIYALDNNIERIADDHRRALKLGEVLKSVGYVSEVLTVDTNIVIFRVDDQISEEVIVKKLAENDILAIDMDRQTIRLVTHLDFDDSMLAHTESVLINLK